MWRLLYTAAWNVAGWVARAPGDGKVVRTLRGRRAAADRLVAWARTQRDPARPLVWFHAASVGEGRQGESVLRLLRASRPECQLAWTFASASAERLARSVPADVADYLPMDTTDRVARTLEALRPSVLVFAATDLWPVLVREAHARDVRLALVSATLAPTSSRRGALARTLLGPSYAALDAVGAIDARDADALAALGARRDRITVTGDTRHDAAATRAAAVDRGQPALRALAGGRPVLLAGSTWPADERVLVPAVAAVRAAHQLRLVIAPHEPTPVHLAVLERLIARSLPGASVVRLSGLEGAEGDRSRDAAVPASSWDVCLVDRVGILADLYAGAAVAFIGGGFHGAGLHSVIEPAALGVPAVFGPRWSSSNDARLLIEAGGAVCTPDGGSLAGQLGRWLADTAGRAAAGRAARGVVDRGLGASGRSVAMLEGLLNVGR